MAIKGLHHNAYGCIDSEATRKFYEDFLGLPLACTLWLEVTKSGRPTEALHTFYEMDDGSYLAFFEEKAREQDYKEYHDFELHIALEVDQSVLEPMLKKGKEWGIETRGVSDHDFIHSIYFRDPNGYVIELCAKQPNHDAATNRATNEARALLDKWTGDKASSVGKAS